MAHSPWSPTLSALRLKGQLLDSYYYNARKFKCEKRHQQHTNFLFAVIRRVLRIITEHRRVGLPICRAVIKVTLEIKT